jgi:hypothetical protein
MVGFQALGGFRRVGHVERLWQALCHPPAAVLTGSPGTQVPWS